MNDSIHTISRQFLCGISLNEFIFPCNIEDISLESQKYLLDQTVNSDLVKDYPLKIEYQKAFLKYLLQKLEKSGCEVHDDFYAIYGKLVSCSGSSLECYKHYILKGYKSVITLKENIQLISEGTTGLRTWQASIALSEWSLKNKQILQGKTILELGSGVGLTGLVIGLNCSPKKYFFTDCHGSVLKTLCENVELNIKKYSKNIDSADITLDARLHDGSEISVVNVFWQDVDLKLCQTFGEVDLVLAADVVYDSELFLPLIEALKCISVHCGTKEIVFACTERNPATLSCFLKLIGESFQIDEQSCPTQDHFFWGNTPKVRFFKFTLNSISAPVNNLLHQSEKSESM